MALAQTLADTPSAPEARKRKSRLAEIMLQQGMDASPVQHWTQGAARLAQALVGGSMAGQAGREESAERAEGARVLTEALGGAGGPNKDRIAALLANPATADVGQKLAVEALSPQKAPNSMREFEMAQNNPAYAQFLDRKRPQTNINMKTMGTIPPGYRAEYNEQGLPVQLVPIPGSPDARKIEDAERAAATSADQKSKTANIVVDAIDRADKMIEANPALTAGVGGTLLSKMPGTDANNVRALMDTVKANAGFDRLQQMRDSSPTGGALGQVSEREIAYLQATIGNLEQSQTVGQLRENMKKVRDAYSQIIHGPGGGDDGGWQTLPNGIKIREKK